MRSLKTILFFSLFFLLVAANAKDNFILHVRKQGHYGTQETRVFKNAKEWICKTELTPLHVSPVQPFSTEKLKKLELSKVSVSSLDECRDKVWVTDKTTKKTKTYSGCADDLFFKPLIEEINAKCGRN